MKFLIFLLVYAFSFLALGLEVVKVKGSKAVLRTSDDFFTAGDEIQITSGSTAATVRIKKVSGEKALVDIISGQLRVGPATVVRSEQTSSAGAARNYFGSSRNILVVKLGMPVGNTFNIKDRDIGNGSITTNSPIQFGLALGKHQIGKFGYEYGIYSEGERKISSLNFAGQPSSQGSGRTLFKSALILEANLNYGFDWGFQYSYLFAGPVVSSLSTTAGDMSLAGINLGVGGVIGGGVNYEIAYRSVAGKSADGASDFSYAPIILKLGYAVSF